MGQMSAVLWKRCQHHRVDVAANLCLLSFLFLITTAGPFWRLIETIKLLQSLTSFFLFLAGFPTAFSANVYYSCDRVTCMCKVEFSCQFEEDER